MATLELQLPPQKHHLVIGSGGATIKALKADFNVSVNVPKKEENSTTITLIGEPGAVAKAKAKIDEIVGISLSSKPLLIAQVKIPANKISLLIGPKGVNEKKIQKAANVILILPQKSDTPKTEEEILIYGTSDEITVAKKEITTLLGITLTEGSANKAQTKPAFQKLPLKNVNDALFFGEPNQNNNSFNKFLQYIGSATTTIDICVFTISEDLISNLIIDLHKSGVKVRVVTDDDCSLAKGSDIATFHKEGISVRMDNSQFHMHHKFCIIDSICILNGSFNWTRQGHTENKENVVVCSDRTIVKAFQTEFDKLWTQYEKNPLKFDH